jgi:hypothetical protein
MAATKYLYNVTLATGRVIHALFQVIQVGDLPQLLGAMVAMGSGQSILNVTTTAISWDNPPTRDDNNYWASGHPTRLTAPIAGWYTISCHSKWSANVTGKRVMDIRINGSTYYASHSGIPTPGSGDGPDVATCMTVYLNAADYAECTVFQDSGGSLTVSGAQMQIVSNV